MMLHYVRSATYSAIGPWPPKSDVALSSKGSSCQCASAVGVCTFLLCWCWWSSHIMLLRCIQTISNYIQTMSCIIMKPYQTISNYQTDPNWHVGSLLSKYHGSEFTSWPVPALVWYTAADGREVPLIHPKRQPSFERSTEAGRGCE